MHEIIISDTSCLILLSKMEKLSLLQTMYENIMITEIVAEEYGEPLPEYIKVKKLSDIAQFSILAQEVDQGEASSIALALEIHNSTLLLDDKKARRMALKLNIPFTGLVGVFVKAKKNGKISEIKPYLNELKNSGMWISESLLLEVLKEANEL